MGREKNSKGNVSIYEDRTTLRLRWRHLSKRYSLNLFAASKPNLLRAKKIALIIEHDMISAHFDDSLGRYRELVRERVHKPGTSQKAKFPELPTQASAELQVSTTAPLKLLKEFDRYITAKSMDPGSEDLSSYYTQTKAMLKKWGSFDLEDAPLLLGKEPFGPKTFNDRRNCLFKFFKYLVRKGKLASNPLEDVATKKRQRNTEKRKPFTEVEVTAILHALKTDQFRKKCSYRSHAQFYPMVAFMVQTGVRNAEAIGLQVRDVLWESNEIKICRALARTSRGTNEAARKEKGTKTNNVRFIPMNEFLMGLLKPLCTGKVASDLVFTNDEGRMIDDRMFQRRTFKPVLQALGIQDRDLYSCRHTFATRAVQAGMKAHEVAYLMGDNLQTVIANYYHNEKVSAMLPSFSLDMLSTQLKASQTCTVNVEG